MIALNQMGFYRIYCFIFSPGGNSFVGRIGNCIVGDCFKRRDEVDGVGEVISRENECPESVQGAIWDLFTWGGAMIWLLWVYLFLSFVL